MPRSRNWVFTDFNVSDERQSLWLSTFDTLGFVRFQLEEAPGSGRLHLQGECHFKRGSRDLSYFNKNFAGAHLEVKRSNWENDYCSKSVSRVSGPRVSGCRPAPPGRSRDDRDPGPSLDTLREMRNHLQALPPSKDHDAMIKYVRVEIDKRSKIDSKSIADYLKNAPSIQALLQARRQEADPSSGSETDTLC